MNLDQILREFDAPNRSDLDTIRAVLPHCSQQICVSFALHCALDISHLNPDKRSKVALDAVALWLKTGTKIPQDVIDAANAAYAAYAANAAYAAYAAYAANAAAYAAYAANAAYAAAYAAYAAAKHDPNTYADKMRGYLNKLKELVVGEAVETGVVQDGDTAWLVALVI